MAVPPSPTAAKPSRNHHRNSGTQTYHHLSTTAANPTPSSFSQHRDNHYNVALTTNKATTNLYFSPLPGGEPRFMMQRSAPAIHGHLICSLRTTIATVMHTSRHQHCNSSKMHLATTITTTKP